MDMFRYTAFGRNDLLEVKPGRPRLSVSDPDQPALFLSLYGTPTVRDDVEGLFETLKDRTGPEHFGTMCVSPRVCRHTFAVTFLEGGGDTYQL